MKIGKHMYWGKRLKYRLDNLKWWFLHRTVDKYHVVDTGLEPGYYDVPERMLHACFQLLVDYVEKEQPNEITEWDSVTEHSDYAKEIKELYEWWKNRNDLAKEWDKLHSEFPAINVFNRKDKCIDKEMLAEYEKRVDIILKMENEERKRENTNLIRLIKIKDYLWT